MRASPVINTSRLLIVFASLLLLQACTPSSGNFSSAAPSVEEAFLTPGIIQVKPYTRSIINSTNF